MKSMPFIILFFALISPFNSYSQDYEEEVLPEEEVIAVDELAMSAENAEVGEIERQEDMIHPEGENEWSLGGEDLPSEEYE